jgi:hypothetical protein
MDHQRPNETALEPTHQPRVLNKYKMKPGETGVYCGRGSPWGNPVPIEEAKDISRNDVCDWFNEYLDQRPFIVEQAKVALRGKNLICFCAPARCHCDEWLKIVNE